jgi:hypothetical protein
MSNILVNTIKDTGNNTLLSSDGSGSVTLGSKFPQNTPAFSANRTTYGNTLTTNVDTKVIYNNEYYDTDSAYDTSNGRFTVPSGKAGKYFFCATVAMNANYAYVRIKLRKNGTAIFRGTAIRIDTSGTSVSATIDLAVGDYVEVYVTQDSTNDVEVGDASHFHGYRLIGA